MNINNQNVAHIFSNYIVLLFYLHTHSIISPYNTKSEQKENNTQTTFASWFLVYVFVFNQINKAHLCVVLLVELKLESDLNVNNDK